METLNELLETIEKNAINNKATIENVGLFVKAWKREKESLQLSKTDVSGSFFSIYFSVNGMKMWYSLLKNENGIIEENYVSHPYRRVTYTSNLLKDKMFQLKKLYPQKDWHFEEVF
jgi:hypothetical protein